MKRRRESLASATSAQMPQRRLEQAQENLVRLLDILGELESRVGPLKVQSEKAAAFLDLSAEKKELEIGVGCKAGPLYR